MLYYPTFVMLSKHLQKIKSICISNYKSDLFVAAIIFFVSISSFGLGRLSAVWQKKQPIQIEQSAAISNTPDQTAGKKQYNNTYNTQSQKLPLKRDRVYNDTFQQGYVGSKNGKNYHYPWCAGALKIKGGNKIWFESKDAAEKAGYRAAGNCPGL